MVAILGHAALILVGYAALDDLPWLTELNVLMNEYEDMTSAVVAVGILVGIGLLAIRAVRTVMPYELWKFLHLATYVVLLLGYGHQFADGQQLFRPGPARTYWIGLYVAVLVCLAWGRRGRAAAAQPGPRLPGGRGGARGAGRGLHLPVRSAAAPDRRGPGSSSAGASSPAGCGRRRTRSRCRPRPTAGGCG